MDIAEKIGHDIVTVRNETERWGHNNTTKELSRKNRMVICLKIFLLLCLLGWDALAGLCFYLDNPPFDPRSMCVYLCYVIMVAFSLEMFCQFLVRSYLCTLSHGGFLINCVLHHTFTIIFLFTPLLMDEEIAYIGFLVFLSVELNAVFMKVRRILTRGSCFHTFINFLFLF
eukprot:UN26042